jgi:hypothetical protein
MCFYKFICFNRVCGFLRVYNILVNCMFQVYVFVMFVYKAYIFVSRPCFRSWACFCIKAMFQYQSSPCFSSKFLDHFTVYSLFLKVQRVLCFYVFMFYYFHPFKRHSSKNYIIFLQVFMYYIFNMCHIFINCISFMFYIPRFFLRVIFSFSFL